MNRADLIDTLGEWLDRDDLETKADTFIVLTEARLNRLLEDPDMEVSTTLTGDGASLPVDFGSMVSIGTSDGYPLAQMGNEEYAAIRPISGISRYYTIRAGKIYYVPGSANPTLIYRRKIPALTSSNTTNWLLDRAPDVYLYGCLVQAFGWDMDDDRVAGWKGMFDEAINELRTDGARRKWGAGPIAPRIRRA
jgi:hypothetical protein